MKPDDDMTIDHPVVSHEEWLDARRALLEKEKAFTHQSNIHYHYLDLVPKGRDEGGRGPHWVRRRDEYE